MKRPLLISLEGANDLEFLVRLSDRLRAELPDLPDLRRWQAESRIMLVPVGGGNPASWPDRFRPLKLCEFHLYDREQWPETNVRIQAIARVNTRPGCRGVLTAKRTLENYLHPQAIAHAGGGEVPIGDHNPVSYDLARRWYKPIAGKPSWESLDRRTRHRLTGRAKRWLNSIAVEQMTVELLLERDPCGEVLGWFQLIDGLIGSAAELEQAS